MATSWWAPMAMLFFFPALTGAMRSRSAGALLGLFGADLIVVAIAVVIHAIDPDDARWIGAVYMAALAALLLTGTLLGGVVRFGTDNLVARRASSSRDVGRHAPPR
jgi:hypothetical protein